MMTHYDVIVVGGGVAGMTSALNVLRNGNTVLLIEQSTIGGQISYSPRVDNFPTIASISGSELSDRLLDQILALGAELEVQEVLSVDKQDDVFVVRCDIDTFSSTAVVIASGCHPRTLGLEHEPELIGRGISYCALCDGAFYKDKPVTLVGDGNTALQYAIFLSNMASHVTICTMGEGFSAETCHVNTISERDNVTIMHNVMTTKLCSTNGVLSQVVLTSTIDNSTTTIDTDALFVAIGQIPDNTRYANLVDIDKYGYIVADDTCTTKTAGLYVAGDCRTKHYRQLTTAMADGAVAGNSACAYLK